MLANSREIMVEKCAEAGNGLTDDASIAAGAKIIETRAEIYGFALHGNACQRTTI